MNEITNSNLEKRLGHIRGQLGQLAYQRRDHEIAIEKIDLQVTQMEAQGVMLEATQNDIKTDEQNEVGRQQKEREDERKKRSDRAKAAAAKKKRATTKETPRKGKAATTA